MSSKLELKPWESLSDLEKREAVALRLGWGKIGGPQDEITYWQSTEKPHRSSMDLPGWPANDGLAFAEVWPKIQHFPICVMLAPSGNPCVSGLSADSLDRTWSDGGTYADAICRAAYELLEEAK